MGGVAMTLLKRLLFIVVVYLFSLGVLGCSAMHKKQQASYNELLSAGKYSAAANATVADADKNDMLGCLHHAYALRLMQNYNGSVKYFDRSEALYKASEEDRLYHQSTKLLSAALVNESITAYTGNLYEMTMVNIYKGISFLLSGDPENARVELNRALDRQRRAKEYFDSEIQSELAKAEKARNSTAANATGQASAPAPVPSASDTIAKNDALKKGLAQHYSNLENFEPYANYTNPFATYFSGVYFLLMKDYPRALDLLKEASAMCPGNTIIKQDLELAYQRANSITPATVAPAPEAKPKGGKKTKASAKKAPALPPPPPVAPENPRYAWVVVENGSGPALDSLVIPIPLLLVTTQALYTQVALPKQVPGVCATEAMTVASSRETSASEQVADLNAISATEFKARFSAILLRAVTSATVKAAMQVAGKKLGGDLGQIGALIYGAVVNQADTRYWVSLPLRYDIAKVRIDETDGELQLNLSPGQSLSVRVDPAKNALLFVNLRTSASTPYVDSISLD
jgi:hypothetical protein